ncbi:hypothetical protein PS903_00907 [Pseudomonas fluorescens]|nr:hypothetical protein PS903_00907 [Pseudomonas fluorescens]
MGLFLPCIDPPVADFVFSAIAHLYFPLRKKTFIFYETSQYSSLSSFQLVAKHSFKVREMGEIWILSLQPWRQLLYARLLHHGFNGAFGCNAV